jgi:hypothetical protein
MFTIDEYVGVHKDSPDWDDEKKHNASLLIDACSKLKEKLDLEDIRFQINPRTGCIISGETYGGFRPKSCPIGAENSSHKQGKAVDIYDPHGDIDTFLLENPELLVECGIYIEHPAKTNGWSHWAIKTSPEDSPRSGHHIFFP